MPEAVALDREKQLMRVRFDPNATVDDWKSTLVLVRQLSEETGIRRVLIDVRDQTELANTTTLYEFARQLPKSISFAVVCDIHLENHRFIETVATNRGLRVKDFITEPDAIEWLMMWPNTNTDE